MTSLNSQQSTTMKARLRERAAQLRDEIQHTLERSSDETHVRIAERIALQDLRAVLEHDQRADGALGAFK